MDVDRSNIEEIIELHHEANTNVESGNEQENRKAKEHTALGIESRHQKSE